MDTHVKIVGWLWIIVGALGLLGALCAIVSIAGGGLISGDQDALIATSITATVIGGIVFVLSIPNIIAGIGLLTRVDEQEGIRVAREENRAMGLA